jgi:superfamily I DNA/RNA helicase
VLDLSTLNPPQREAVTVPEGPLLVLAGAGSGKTRVIAHRVAWLLERGEPPVSLLAVTFTNKAAREMRERVRALAGPAGAQVLVATFHGFGLWLLGQEHAAAGLPRRFGVCDAGDQMAIVRRCLREVQVDDRRFDAKRVLAVLSRAKSALQEGIPVRPEGQGDDYDLVAARVWPRYQEALRAQKSLDFDDLIARPVGLLAGDAALRARWRERFRHVLVDEFQDTNDAQLRLLDLLCAPEAPQQARRRGAGGKAEGADPRGASGPRANGRKEGGRSTAGRSARGRQEDDREAAGRETDPGRPAGRGRGGPGAEGQPPGWTGRSLCAVGDDDQAIYGWRGAEVRHILGFERRFPGARVVRLEQNYRSTGNVLACANAVIARAARRHAKRLWTGAGPGDPVRVVALEDDEEEARFVAGEIGRARAEGRRLEDVAVLYRLNAQSRPLEEALREAGLPHVVRGGPAFFDRAEVRDVLGWLKVCAVPHDDVSLARIADVPPRGIGDVSLGRLGEWAAAQRVPLFRALRRAPEAPGLPRGAAERMGELAALVERMQARFRGGRLAEAARALVAEIGLLDHVRGSVRSPEAGARKVEAVEGVLRSLEAWEQRERRPTLEAFLQRLALDSRDEEPEESAGVTLMTLHGAKGLEFPTVFLVGCEEDLLPVAGIQGEARDLEEERRLAYVGITRAREVLWLTRAKARARRGKVDPRTPSRFLADLPAGAWAAHDPSSASSPVQAAARSAEVVAALRARLAGRRG